MARCTALFSWIVLGAAMALAQIPPTASASGTPKFNVASIKVVDRNSLGRGGGGRAAGGPGTSDPGRFSYPAATMLGLLMKAFGVESGQVFGAAVQPRVGADFYEVTATMPPDTTEAQFQTMLQNLLAERFHLVVHHEIRNFPAYELVVDKGGPKLKERASRSDDGPKTANPMNVNFQSANAGNITLKDQTIEDLAERLGMTLLTVERIQTQNMNLPAPRVVDKTGLTGKYTFSLDFTPPGFAPGPDSPTDLPDFYVALREKLGLRLNKTAGVPVDVIVVDSVDKLPVAN
ncbi:MAG TPA: TIGR03435 family protein [Bryobacteraceae bacterium]|jgi:uncharacterized protein (TIGR03435 family)